MITRSGLAQTVRRQQEVKYSNSLEREAPTAGMTRLSSLGGRLNVVVYAFGVGGMVLQTHS